ncbi:MAG: glycosyltransferase family 39 protein [Chloroflexota bacterium]|nr:glycosyltransferase family 39 protein [Chloroflexota bacterium]
MTKTTRSDTLFWALLVFLVILFMLWQWQPIHSFAWKYDEGINTVKAQLLLDHYHLYSDIWSDQPPLFTFMLVGTFALFGESVIVGRLLVLALAGLALLSLAWVTVQLTDKAAAILAAVALASFPHFHELSQLIMIGLPAISFGLLALVFGFRYQSTGKQRWLLLAGVSFGLGLLIKPIIAPMLLPLSILSLGTWETQIPVEKRVRGGMLFVSATIAPILIALVFYSPYAFIQQVVGTLFEAREAHGSRQYLAENVRQISAYLFHDKWRVSHVGLFALAFLGIASLIVHRQWDKLMILGTWLGGTFGAVVFHAPLRRHQLLLIIPPLIVTAGLAIQQLLEGARGIADTPPREQLLMAIIVIALLPVGINLPRTVRANISIRKTLLAENQESRAGSEAIRFLRIHTPEGSSVITDDPMLAFKANRSIPPHLAVPSARRIESQELSSKELVRLTKNTAPAAILFWEQRLIRLEEYATWVRENFHTVHAYADGRWIYLPQDATPISFPQPISTEEGICILGSNIESLTVEAGGNLSATIFLQTKKPLTSDYTLFMHLLDEEGNVWGQKDLPPLDRYYPSSAWHVEEVIAQTVDIGVAQDAPPGEKILSVGFYGPDGDRLLLYDDQRNPLQSKQVVLAPHPVVRWQASYALPAMEHRQQALFGDYIELRGYNGPSLHNTAGETFEITLYWRCLRVMNTSYTAFVHLLDEKGNLIAQRDQIPGQGAYPTSGWLPDEVIADTYTIPLPEDLESGIYRLSIGLYELSTGERLPVKEKGKPIPERCVVLDQELHYEP